MTDSKYITLETAQNLLGMTVDSHKRLLHHYPLTVIRGVSTGKFYILDRNAVMMPIGKNDRIPYDFIVKEKMENEQPAALPQACRPHTGLTCRKGRDQPAHFAGL